MTTTLEEAKQCPKCGMPGEEVDTRSHPDGRGKQIMTVMCVTTLCPWFETPYWITINSDGSIPEPYSDLKRGEKKYPKLSPEIETNIRANMEQQLGQEIQPGGGEIRNPNSER
jgi:hypothetical protein